MLTRQEEQILLVIHSLKDNAYLVTIREKLGEATGRHLDLGTIYIPLKRLEERGYLDSFLGEPTSIRGGKAIKYYRIKKRGYSALAELKKAQDKLWDKVSLPVGK
jgi:PadR family transcriptional regulator PadR